MPLDANRTASPTPSCGSIPKATPRSNGPRRKTQEVMKLIIQPDDGLTPLLQAVKRAKKTIDIVIFRFDRAGAREGACRRRRPRRRRARADRAHQPRRREEPAQARDAAARRRRHRGADRRRPDALSRQDDDRRRRPARLRLQLHQARHRAEPQLRHRDQRQAPGQGGVHAVHGRRHAPALLAGARALRRQPGELARPADGVHSRRQEAAADLRRPGVGQR